MIREILLFALIIYGLYKLGLFRSLGATFHNEGQPRKRHDGNVHVDSTPPQKKSDYKGGDYIDYEEVK